MRVGARRPPITALMTARGYLGSARIAAAMGPYERYAENRDAHNAVMRMHRDASYAIPDVACEDTELLEAARATWEQAVSAGEQHGYRNAQATVLAPTGTISFLMDCDTTGVEPDFSLVKFKELVGGGQMTIVNRTVPLALQTLGYSAEQIDQILAHINEHGTIIGAPGLADEHLPVFDVAVGERAISHMGHLKMMGAVQPFISGRDLQDGQPARVGHGDGHRRCLPAGLAPRASRRWPSTATDPRPPRRCAPTPRSRSRCRMPRRSPPRWPRRARRRSRRRSRRRWRKRRPSASGCRASASRSRTSSPSAATRATSPPGMYDDGTVGEIFLTDIGKEGSTLRGMMNSFATAISISLQYGVPLETLVRKFAYMRFEPEGMTSNPEIPFAKSMPDYIMRWLASRFLDVDLQEELGILTKEVRARKAAQDALTSTYSDTARPVGPSELGNGAAETHEHTSEGNGSPVGPGNGGSPVGVAAAAAFTDEPPVIPAMRKGLDLGPACQQCGGMMQRTGSCYTCSSCGFNTGCG